MRKKSLFKTTALILSLVTVLAMSACGSKNNTVTTDNTNTETKAVTVDKKVAEDKTTEQTDKSTEAASVKDTEVSDTSSVEIAINDTPATDNNDNNGGNSTDNDNNSSDTPTPQPDVPDTPSEPEYNEPEYVPDESDNGNDSGNEDAGNTDNDGSEDNGNDDTGSSSGTNYIHCQPYLTDTDCTEEWAITWDTITPTSNKYIYYNIREDGVYRYFIFNESIDTAIMLCNTLNPDVEEQTKIYAKSHSNLLPYLIY